METCSMTAVVDTKAKQHKFGGLQWRLMEYAAKIPNSF